MIELQQQLRYVKVWNYVPKGDKKFDELAASKNFNDARGSFKEFRT